MFRINGASVSQPVVCAFRVDAEPVRQGDALVLCRRATTVSGRDVVWLESDSTPRTALSALKYYFASAWHASGSGRSGFAGLRS